MSQPDKLVLHICCAPDEAYVVKKLKDEYDLCCFFSNPNIQPEEEYAKRLDEAEKVAERFGVPFASATYTPESWEDAVADCHDTPEGGERCKECFLLRFRETAAYCAENNVPRFTSVMSISPHKRIAMLNETGAIAAKEHGVEYVPFDFKKKNGFLESIALSKELDLYRQDYCGCRLSLAERNERARRRGDAV